MAHGDRQYRYLARMGIPVWRQRPIRECEQNFSSEVVSEKPLEPSDPWPALRASVAACEQCSLYQTRTQTVFGVGSTQADWVFVGEAPGFDEDRQGEPFVGRAGQLLNAMLFAMG